MNSFSKDMLIIMAEEFYELQLGDLYLSQTIEGLETWLSDIRGIEDELLENEETIYE